MMNTTPQEPALRRRTTTTTWSFAFSLLIVAVIVGTGDAFATSTSNPRHSSTMRRAASNVLDSADFQDALERKNASRQKFGLAPLSESEFVETQRQVYEMQQAQEAKLAESRRTQPSTTRKQAPQPNFLESMFQSAMTDSCESSFDCPSPQVCCDLGVKKMCCSNGKLEVKQEYAMVPVPVDMRQ